MSRAWKKEMIRTQNSAEKKMEKKEEEEEEQMRRFYAILEDIRATRKLWYAPPPPPPTRKRQRKEVVLWKPVFEWEDFSECKDDGMSGEKKEKEQGNGSSLDLSLGL